MMMVLMISTLLGLSSSNWVMIWINMEIGLLAMCSMLGTDMTMKSSNKTQIMKYFIVQAMSSLFIILSLTWPNNKLVSILFLFALLMKMGSWPFMGWYISVIQHTETNVISLVIIMTWQKILPTYLLFSNMTMNSISVWVTTIMLSLLLPIGLLKSQLSLKKTMALSSVSNNSWFMVLTLSIPLFMLFLMMYAASLYCLFYVMSKSEKMKETKDKLGLTPLMVIMNMGGMPPFPMFWTKLLSLSIMLSYNTTEYIILVLLLSSCVFMYFYMKSTMLTTLSSKNMSQMNGWLIISHSFMTIEIISTVVIMLIATLFFIFI